MKTIKTLVLGAIASLSFTSALFAEAELDGYCPVCYIAAGKAVLGTEEFSSEYKGHTYYFVKSEAVEAFEANPEKFLPAYDGLCAYGVSLGKKFEGDPTQFSVVDGKIYLNSSAETKALFDADPASFVKNAEMKWETVSKH